MKIKKSETRISPEKMALLAEKGIKATRLSRAEKESLLQGGLDELQHLRVVMDDPVPLAAPDVVDAIIQEHFSIAKDSEKTGIAELWIKLRDDALELAKGLSGWNVTSPAFAYRGESGKDISFYKEIGKVNLYLEILHNDSRCADLHIRLTDTSKRDTSFFEIQLLKGERCIEAIHTYSDKTVLLSAIEIGNYKLRFSDAKGEIISLALRMEQ